MGAAAAFSRGSPFSFGPSVFIALAFCIGIFAATVGGGGSSLRAGGPHARHAFGTSPSSLFVRRRTVAVRRQPWMSFQRGGIGSEKG